MSLIDRLKIALEESGATKSELARACGVKPASVSDWLSGKSKSMRAHTAQKAAAFLKVNPVWLATGEGSKDMDVNALPANLGAKKIPLLSFVQAGELTDVGHLSADNFSDFMYVSEELPDDCFGLVVSGRSMEPDFREGDKLVIDPNLGPMPGDFVVARGEGFDGNNFTFKKYRPRGIDDNGNDYFELVPLNEDYPSIYSNRTPCQIVGVMIQHIRDYRRGR